MELKYINRRKVEKGLGQSHTINNVQGHATKEENITALKSRQDIGQSLGRHGHRNSPHSPMSLCVIY